MAADLAIGVHGVVGDFHEHLDDIPDTPGAARLVAFLGSTIGNLTPVERARFLADVADLLGPDDRFLVATDLVKPVDRLIAAYDDAAGVTAAFNRNLLSVLNRELGADFEIDRFAHRAVWDPENSWIEMRLLATDADDGEAARDRPRRRLRRRRADAHRDQHEVHPRGRGRRPDPRRPVGGRDVAGPGGRLPAHARPSRVTPPPTDDGAWTVHVTVPPADVDLVADVLLRAGAAAVEERSLAAAGSAVVLVAGPPAGGDAEPLLAAVAGRWPADLVAVDLGAALDAWRDHARPVRVGPAAWSVRRGSRPIPTPASRGRSRS